MAVTTAQTVDVSAILRDMLSSITGVRLYPFVSDATRPPAVVIGQPEIDFVDQSAGFCNALWEFPFLIVTTRANDWAAQAEMSRLVFEVAAALNEPTPVGVFSIEPQVARPNPVTVGGQELPGYLLPVRVRA